MKGSRLRKQISPKPLNSMLKGIGVETYTGLYLRQHAGFPSLVTDIIRPFRRIVEYSVYKLANGISTNQVSKNSAHFTVYSGKHYDFWKHVQNGKWEPETFTVLNKYLNRKHSYIDIGAWIGPTVLYGCQLAKHCYAFEPDPVAFQELRSNVRLNKALIPRITLCNLALSNSSRRIRLYQGTLPGHNSEWGNSMSSLLPSKDKSSMKSEPQRFRMLLNTTRLLIVIS